MNLKNIFVVESNKFFVNKIFKSFIEIYWKITYTPHNSYHPHFNQLN